MSGSGGDSGYDYQAACTAFVATSLLAGQPLDWFDDSTDVPSAIEAESDGPGDDLRIETVENRVIELQAKLGLRADGVFWDAILRLAHGLNADPALRAVLMVDPRSSQTITSDFRNDLLRGGRQDHQTDIMEQVRARLGAIQIDATLVLPRMRVIVKDFEPGSDGRAAAKAILRQIVDSPDADETAWRLLTDEGHKLIKARGRRDAHSLASLLGRHVRLKANSACLPVVIARYTQWLVAKTSRFYVPGLGIKLPIEDAWIRVHAMDDRYDRRPGKESLDRMLREYREWERLAVDSGHHTKIDLGFLPEFSRRVVVLGGPGSGKSTLLQRLAHDLTKQGRVVVAAIQT